MRRDGRNKEVLELCSWDLYSTVNHMASGGYSPLATIDSIELKPITTDIHMYHDLGHEFVLVCCALLCSVVSGRHFILYSNMLFSCNVRQTFYTIF
jgi:hypothetical protein